MYNPEKSLSSRRQDSQRDSSSMRSNRDSSPRPASAKHVINWSDKHNSTLHSEPVDPMILEAKIANWHNNRIDQQASTSCSGLERGGLGQLKDEWLLPRDLICGVFKRLDTSTFIRVYRSFDRGYKFLRILNDEKRQEVIGKLKFGDLVEHFNTLEASREKKEFLGWLNSNHIAHLYQQFKDSPNKQKEILSETKFEQIKEFYFTTDFDKRQEFYKVIPLKYLEKLASELQGLDASNARSSIIIRQCAEYFNTLETPNERKAFVRELKPTLVASMYQYFEDDPNKQKEICRSMAKEDFQKWAYEYGFFRLEELNVYNNAERFSGLETLSERKKFLEGFDAKGVANVYQYFEDDPNKQKEICRSITLKGLKSFIEHLNFEESEVARRYLKEWNGM